MEQQLFYAAKKIIIIEYPSKKKTFFIPLPADEDGNTQIARI
jgi:hypothetical protein